MYDILQKNSKGNNFTSCYEMEFSCSWQLPYFN